MLRRQSKGVASGIFSAPISHDGVPTECFSARIGQIGTGIVADKSAIF
jgi:hypothetical protein